VDPIKDGYGSVLMSPLHVLQVLSLQSYFYQSVSLLLWLSVLVKGRPLAQSPWQSTCVDNIDTNVKLVWLPLIPMWLKSITNANNNETHVINTDSNVDTNVMPHPLWSLSLQQSSMKAVCSSPSSITSTTNQQEPLPLAWETDCLCLPTERWYWYD